MLTKLQPTKKISVDGVDYVVQLYSPSDGLTLYAKLLRLLGEPFIKLIGMIKGKDGFNFDSMKESLGDQGKGFSLDDLNIDALGEAIGLLFTNLKPEEFVPLIQDILSGTKFLPSMDPVNDQFETYFMGRYNHVFKLVGKTLGVQYPDFLSGIAKRVSAARTVSDSDQKEKTTA